MCQYGSKALIIILYRNLGHCLTPPIDKLLHTLQVLTRLPVWLPGLSNNDTLHLLMGDICLQILKKSRSSNSRQPSRYNLERIGDC